MGTDLTSAEESARRSLSDLSARAAGIGTYVMHLPSRELLADDLLLELSGIERGAFGGRPEDVYARVHPDDVGEVTAGVERAVASAGAYSAEYRVVGPDGGHRWVAARGQTVLDDDGAVTALIGAAHDVSAVREATARTADVLESMAVGYLSLDAEWRITYVNAEGRRVLGATGREIVGEVIWELYPATVGTEYERSYRAAAETGRVVTFDAYYPAPLDAWFELRAAPEDGGVALYFLDITARRRAQEAAELSGRRLAALGEVALALTDADDIAALVTTMAEQGLRALGADGGAVAIPDPDDPTVLWSYITASYGRGVQADYGNLPRDAALPVCEASRTGRPVLLPDTAASTAYSPQMVDVVEATGCVAWASLPLRASSGVIGVLTAGWRSPQDFDADQLHLLETLASQCAQALARITARDAERRATSQQAALVAVAQALGQQEDEAGVLAVVASRGLGLLGSSTQALCLREPSGGVRTLTTPDTRSDISSALRHLPGDFPLPLVDCAMTGRPSYLEDLAQTVAGFPAAEPICTALDVHAQASVPLRARDQLLGSLSLGFAHPRTWPQADRDLLEAFATLTAQALERIGSRAAERTASVEVARFSETLQRSLLTSPPEPDHLQIAVRYAPAAAQAQVGGDWHDAFISDDGTTSLVIGDVTGHDRHAAAVMAQMRNLLRGIGYTLGDPPALVLSALDRAVRALGVDGMATAVLAQVVRPPEHPAAGTLLLRWSNAGHPPPLLITPGQAPRFLVTPPELLLGLDPGASRSDHEVVLPPGATVLLYTDGLVERRSTSLDEGLAWLATAVAAARDLPVDRLCDHLLARVGGHVEDDVAMIAVRAHPGTVTSVTSTTRAAAPDER